MEEELTVDQFVLPGEPISADKAKINKHCFYQEDGKEKSLYFGLLNNRNLGGQDYLTIMTRVTTYMPEKNHFVVGVIKNKIGDNLLVDINAPLDATLPGLDFDGATKRNKPNLNTGDLVYARVSEFSKFTGAKLSCLNAGYSAKCVLGELKGGTIVYGLSGRETMIESKIETIQKHCQFEVAFGKNSVLWFSCPDSKTEMVLYNIFSQLLKGCSEEVFQSLLKWLQK
jgi:exosome complex component RRP40